ncbi:MAG TPA: Gfo/Idh/MocA family oxidoreductase, partial [Methylomirabilota bacterium]|nr:Gfo/Idh/MocA family oxidoreductase [Methylomirabilota bacterium]
MNAPHSRRHFVRRTTFYSFGLAALPLVARAQTARSPGEKLLVGVMGLGRGLDHVKALQQIAGVEVAYLADVDEARLARAQKSAFATASRPPKTVQDFRRILDDKSIDALFIAAPNHWHAPAAILACAAGKHVYVEKPGSHNAREAELLVAAARKYNRVVQMGNQRRSWPGIREAVERLRAGAIGEVRAARTWYVNARGAIGRGRPVPVPSHLDYNLWQGPAPERPYLDNVVHYNWHWRWHWGGGEIGNNGPHAFDLARWGLGVEYPVRVTCTGGRYHFQDDQETPDTSLATLDFGKKVLVWDGSSCHPREHEHLPFVAWYGDQGTLAIHGNGYRIFDPKGKQVAEGSGPGGDKVHIENFLQAIRGEARPNSEIAVGQTSVLLCHLSNIAYRTARALNINPQTGRIVGDPEAEKLWGREYRPGWEPKV